MNQIAGKVLIRETHLKIPLTISVALGNSGGEKAKRFWIRIFNVFIKFICTGRINLRGVVEMTFISSG